MSYLGTNKIGKMYLGSTAIGKAYLGNDLVFQQGGAQPVMSPYIRGGADGSYIDTGITADNTVKMIVWARNWNPTAGFLFGSRVAFAQNSFCIGAPSGAPTGSIRIDYGQSADTYSFDQFKNLSGYHKYELYQGVLKVDDVVQASATDSTFSNNVNIHLLGVNTDGTHANPGLPIDICACQIYKNDVLVRDFTAVNTPSVGLYDAVSQTLFTNAGSGSLTYGEFDKNAYTPLEYIECSNSQYFDTGVKGSYSLPIVSKIRSTNTTVSWMGYMGVFSSSPASCCAFTFGNQVDRNVQLSFRLGASTSDVRIFIGGSALANLTNIDAVIVKNNNVGTTYVDNVQKGTGTKSNVATTFETNLTMYVGATRSGESSVIDNRFIGRIYYVGLGAQRSFVPAKKGTKVGMYDTYNDVFYSSETDTPFIAGSTI